MPVREELFKSKFCRGTDEVKWPQTSPGSKSSTVWAVEFWNSLQQAKNPTTCTTDWGIPQEGAVPKGGLFIPRCMPLQDVPQRWQLFFSPTGITVRAIVGDAPAPLRVLLCTLGIATDPGSGSCLLQHGGVKFQPLKTSERNFFLK